MDAQRTSAPESPLASISGGVAPHGANRLRIVWRPGSPSALAPPEPLHVNIPSYLAALPRYPSPAAHAEEAHGDADLALPLPAAQHDRTKEKRSGSRWRRVAMCVGGVCMLGLVCVAALLMWGLPGGSLPYRGVDMVDAMRGGAREARELEDAPEGARASHGCAHTRQGKDFAVDERGVVCEREDVLAGGCCAEGAELGTHLCNTCDPTTRCCAVYEMCVACCMAPAHRAAHNHVLSFSGYPPFRKVRTAFQFCALVCRTSSRGVVHENTYASPNHHCFDSERYLPA